MKLVSFLRSWIIDIVIMFIFITVLEMILPNSNMRRYVDVIVGFLIILVTINPFIRLFSKDFDVNKNFLKRSTQVLDTQCEEDQKFLDSNEQQVLEVYKMNMGKEIKNIVENETEYKVKNIDLVIDENLDSEKYGDLINVVLTLDMPLENEKKKEDKIEIKKIVIKDKKNKKKIQKDFKEKDEIKKVISKRCNISCKNIDIYLNTQLEGD